MAGNFSLKGEKIWVAGSQGMVGSAILRRLENEEVNIIKTTRQDYDLTHYAAVDDFYKTEKPDVVFLAAAKVGGIHANNQYPADFLYDNLAIQNNVIHLAAKNEVKKLLFLGSSCIYPRDCPQPIRESYLLSGALEATNQWYAIAKIAGIKLCQAYRKQHGCDFIAVMPSNLYGAHDNFHPENSHVPAALLSRFHSAKINNEPTVTVWGTGRPMREFLHVDDLADACVFLMRNYSDEDPVNVGSGEEISISNFAVLIRSVIKYNGDIVFDHSRPDGTPRKLLDVTRLHDLGWHHTIKLEVGLKQYYDFYLSESK